MSAFPVSFDGVVMKCMQIFVRLLLPLLLACQGATSDSPAQDQSRGTPPAAAAEVAPRNPPRRATESAGDWPCFLGPHHTGISQETGLLDSWPAEGPPRVWDRKLGTGYSAPSILGNRLVMHHRVGKEELVECLDPLTGELLWERADPSQFEDPYGYNNGPRCSPVLTPERCYTLGAEGRLLCLSLADGQLIWERELRKEFTIPEGFFGVGASPLLEGNKLIVLVGGQPDSGVVAFDATTGKTLWENVGKKTWDGAETGWPGEDKMEWTDEEMVVSYASPICETIHGQRHLLCLMRHGLVSLNPETGEERFHYWFRARVHESVNAAQPVVAGDMILITAAYRVGSALLKVQPNGKAFDVVWRSPTNLLAHWSTPIYDNGSFYGFSGRHENEGAFRCLKAVDGDVTWETPGVTEARAAELKQSPDGKIIEAKTSKPVVWPLYGRASKIMADGKFIVLAERGGMLSLVHVDGTKYEEISRCEVEGMEYPCWTAPVLSRGRLYLRCEGRLICLDLRSSP